MNNATEYAAAGTEALRKGDAQKAHEYLSLAVEGGRTENPAVLIFLSLFVNVVFRLVLGLRVADVSNSFRLYRGDDVRRLQLACVNFDIVEEILVKLCAAHPQYRVKEIPFTFGQRQAGKTKRDLTAFARGYLETLWRLWRLKRNAR